jgi:hypothetical protein
VADTVLREEELSIETRFTQWSHPLPLLVDQILIGKKQPDLRGFGEHRVSLKKCVLSEEIVVIEERYILTRCKTQGLVGCS